ncbi:MAG: ATPase [Fluviicola sp.]|nr:MAG: ATPase [Fluviicola sp.]
MNKEDKQRVIGKVVAINSDRFTVELLSGIDNFNISGFDDIHYFAQLNSYVIISYQNYYIVAEVSGVREKDLNVPFSNPKEQILNKVKSGKFLEVLPIGTLKPDSENKREYGFEFGVSVYPALYTDTLYIKEAELDAIFNVRNSGEKICDKWEGDENCPHDDNQRYNTLAIGKSTIFPDYDVKIDINKFFGSHSAILGNTGSGKSCTISSIIQGIFYRLKNYSATGSSFVLFDVNGEYKKAFSEINKRNGDVAVRYLTLDEKKASGEHEIFTLPNWFLNIDEWALLLKATERTQLPILRNALGLASLFSKQGEEDKKKIEETKNHILATCITQILRDESSSPSKKDRITSILQKFNTTDINLSQEFEYTQDNNSESEWNLRSCLQISYGELVGLSPLIEFLEQKEEDIPKFLSPEFHMPIYEEGIKFDFNRIEDAIDLAILFEEAHGNRQIRDYCSSLITRIKSLKDREDFKFLRKTEGDIKAYKKHLLGIAQGSVVKKDVQITILDLSTVEDEVVEVISCVISRLLYETIKNFEPRNTFPVNLILEEAHRYIGHNPQREFLKANTIFDSIAKEGRKFGMFLTVSSQRPSELSKTVLSQCSNFIVHRIQNPEDLSHIRQITPHISDTVLKRMPSIPTQHALIFGHSVNLPTTFKVNEADPLPLSDNNKISENWFKPKDTDLSISTNLNDE